MFKYMMPFLMACIANSAIYDTPISLPILTFGEAIDSADFDNDGFVDAVVATSNNKPDVVYHNKGDQTFNAIVLPGSTTSFGVKCADLNNDGLIDIVVTNASSQNIIYINNGNLSFTKTNVCETATSATDVDVCDLNNDGLKDLIFSTAANGGSADLIAWNLGNFNFSLVQLPGTSLADTVVCADIDGDGDKDIIVGCRAAGVTGYVYQNNGGTFVQIGLGIVSAVSGMASGQFDATPGIEVFAATYNTSYDLIVKYTGSISSPYQYIPIQIPSSAQNRDSVATGDIDLDGDIDAFMSVHNGYDFLYLNTTISQIDFVKVSIPSLAIDKNGVTLSDFDNDGDLDAMIATSGISGAYDLIYWNNTLVKGQDSDSDGMPDIFEILNGLNKSANDSLMDKDGDGVNNVNEFIIGTNISDPLSRINSYLFSDILNGLPILKFDTVGTNSQQYSGMKRKYIIEHSIKYGALSDWQMHSIYIGDGNQKLIYVQDGFFRMKTIIEF